MPPTEKARFAKGFMSFLEKMGCAGVHHYGGVLAGTRTVWAPSLLPETTRTLVWWEGWVS